MLRCECVPGTEEIKHCVALALYTAFVTDHWRWRVAKQIEGLRLALTGCSGNQRSRGRS